jgi:hypothetical protein
VSSVSLGVIKSVSLQTIWPREATDLTPWLAENLAYLSEKLGIELSPEKTEMTCGDFSADIVARDLSTGRAVVIENQYGQSDHRHLGQILTYAASMGAAAVIWIAENSRPEHRIAIDLLNRGMKSTLRFYALELRVIRIDDSRPACTLDLICEPEDEDITAGTEGVSSERSQKYLIFFQSLIDELRNRPFTNARKAQPQNWYSFSSETQACSHIVFLLLSAAESGPKCISIVARKRQ